MKGNVYILTNEHMPGLVKIGRTSGCPQGRASQLYATGVPGPFFVYASVCAPDCMELEARVHNELSECRVSESREFFKIEPHEAARCLVAAHKEAVKVWLEDFLPSFIPVNSDAHVDDASIALLADDAGEPATVIREAMEEVTSEELRPAIIRVYERMARVAARREVDEDSA